MSDVLLLIDGSALIHRAYHGMPDLTNREGKHIGAVYGFVRMLFKAMRDLSPSSVIVAIDRPEPTFRKGIFIGYQAQRPALDEALGEQFTLVRQLIGDLGLPLLDKAGFEADDILGTLSVKTPEEHLCDQVVIVTGDKDLMQLVTTNVHLYMPIKGMSETETVDIARVEERLGVKPNQVVDYKALVGDSSDNYPGVLGIGPKTAIKLLEAYDSYEGIYEHLEEVTETIRNKLIAGKDGGDLSKQLAQICLNVDIVVDWKKGKDFVTHMNHHIKVLEQWGFKTLVKQLSLENKPVEGQIGLF